LIIENILIAWFTESTEFAQWTQRKEIINWKN